MLYVRNTPCSMDFGVRPPRFDMRSTLHSHANDGVKCCTFVYMNVGLYTIATVVVV